MLILFRKRAGCVWQWVNLCRTRSQWLTATRHRQAVGPAVEMKSLTRAQAKEGVLFDLRAQTMLPRLRTSTRREQVTGQDKRNSRPGWKEKHRPPSKAIENAPSIVTVVRSAARVEQQRPRHASPNARLLLLVPQALELAVPEQGQINSPHCTRCCGEMDPPVASCSTIGPAALRMAGGPDILPPALA